MVTICKIWNIEVYTESRYAPLLEKTVAKATPNKEWLIQMKTYIHMFVCARASALGYQQSKLTQKLEFILQLVILPWSLY